MSSSQAGGSSGSSTSSRELITDVLRPNASSKWIQRIRGSSTDIEESCSPGPYLELFARGTRKGWIAWGNQADAYEPTWKTYANRSAAERKKKAATLFDV
jgi:hypothetical protein